MPEKRWKRHERVVGGYRIEQAGEEHKTFRRRLRRPDMHQVGQRHADDLVVLRLGDFKEWFGNMGA